MEVEESSFIVDDNGGLISQCKRIQYDSTNDWKIKVCESEQPQYHMTIEKYELNWLSFLKLTLGHFSAECHGFCAFRWNIWVGAVVSGADC